MGRGVFGFAMGAFSGLAAVITAYLLARVLAGAPRAAPPEPRYAMVTFFQPQPAWTGAQAAAGIQKLKKEYEEKHLRGFESKHFLGAFDRNEFGGFYQFATREDLEAFLKIYPPSPNRTVKVFQVLETWQKPQEARKENTSATP